MTDTMQERQSRRAKNEQRLALFHQAKLCPLKLFPMHHCNRAVYNIPNKDKGAVVRRIEELQKA